MAEAVNGPQKLVRIQDFAAALGLSVAGAWNVLRRDPRSPTPIKIGASTRFSEQDIARYQRLLQNDAERARDARRQGE